jgi:hypothetical protein
MVDFKIMKLLLILTVFAVAGVGYLVMIKDGESSSDDQDREVLNPNQVTLNDSEDSRHRQTEDDKLMTIAETTSPILDDPFDTGLSESDNRSNESPVITYVDPFQEDHSRSKALQSLFVRGPARFGEQVDAFILTESVDEEWAPAAKELIDDWYGDVEGTSGSQYFSECLASVCYMDISASFTEFLRVHRPRLERWISEPLPGFLAKVYSVPTGSEYHRVYFFRDSFNPNDL